MSHLDYANAIFVNLPNSSIYQMQQIQNQAAKLIMNKHWPDSPTTIMRHLHWLPIRFRCEYKMILHVYRCMKGQAPEYLQQKLILRNPAWMTYSATECNFLQIPYNRRKTLADCGFSSAGPRPWNSLPLELQNASSVSNFKKILKTHFFKFAIIYNFSFTLLYNLKLIFLKFLIYRLFANFQCINGLWFLILSFITYSSQYIS